MSGLEDRFDPPEHFVDACDRLHDLVIAQLGSDDFGPDDYLPGLRMLLLSLDYDPRLSDRGRRIAWGEMYSALFARGHAVRAMQQTPGFDQAAIVKPLVITGIPRTGTTALHKLLALDPQFQGLQAWLNAAPMPRPPRETWDANPLFRNAVERLEARYASKPGARAAHDMAAEEVDECQGILRQSFVSNIWTCVCSAATYDLWWQTQSELPAYRHLCRSLQLIGSSTPGKRWLLKNPGHIDNLDLLFAVFPDAIVINTHRDPAKAMPSLCAMLIKSHSVMEVGRLELRARILGVRETEKWANAVRKAWKVRQAHGSQILDVVHADFHRDPMRTIERIYAFARLRLLPEARDAMTQRIAARPELRHGVHRYDVTDFGMTEARIRARFGDYVERFGLAAEAA